MRPMDVKQREIAPQPGVRAHRACAFFGAVSLLLSLSTWSEIGSLGPFIEAAPVALVAYRSDLGEAGAVDHPVGVVAEPHRPTTLLMGPVTPVTNRTGFFSAERSPALMQSFLRSPALGDGMQALRSTHDGLPGLAPGSLLSGCSVSERRQASLMFSGCLSGSSVPSVGMSGFLSAPDSCARSVREMLREQYGTARPNCI